MWNLRRGEIFSVLYFSLCAEQRGKCSDLLVFYVGVGTFNKRCSFNRLYPTCGTLALIMLCLYFNIHVALLSLISLL